MDSHFITEGMLRRDEWIEQRIRTAELGYHHRQLGKQWEEAYIRNDKEAIIDIEFRMVLCQSKEKCLIYREN